MTAKKERSPSTIQKYTEDIVQRFGMKNCNPAFTPGARPERLLNLPENNLLDEESKWRNQSIAGATMYIAQVSWYDTLYAVGHLAKGMSKPSKAYMGVAKHLLR